MKRGRQHTGVKLVTVLFLLLPTVSRATAQELEYKMELGAMAGSSFYMGDVNYTTPFSDLSMAGGVLARYNINPRMVVGGNLAWGRISGSTEDCSNEFPGGGHSAFSRDLYELGARFEYSFFAYGTSGYNDGRQLTPYILAGAGLTFAPKPADNVFALNIPIGIGVKYKVAHRVNLGVEWRMLFTSSDRLDVISDSGLQLDDPYQIEGRGLKNKDSYSLFGVYVTYDLFPKYRKCNN